MNARTDRRILLGMLCAALLLLAAADPVTAKEWESKEYNCVLSVPDSPNPWTWLPEGQDWSSYGIVKGATRIVDKLKSGEPTAGELALVHLIVRDAPEGADAKSLANDKKIREILMGRFGSASDWPEVKVVETTLNDDLPCVVLSAKGQALNAKTGEYSRCEGRLVVTVALKKAYYLRMYAWHTEFDEEFLTIDLDAIEGEFTILKVSEDAPDPPPAVDPAEPENGAEGPGEDEQEEDIDLREYQFRLTKDKRLTKLEPDEDYILKLEGSDAHGYYSIYLYAVENGRIINGQQSPPEDIRKWITEDWWKNFVPNHPEGEIYTFDWPKRVKGANEWITLPDLTDDDRKHIAGGKKKTPIDPSSSDMLKKMECVEKVKNNGMGKGVKAIEPYRGILQGNRARRGKETIVRFAWRSLNHSFRMFVLIGGEGDVKFGEAIRATLESMHHYKD